MRMPLALITLPMLLALVCGGVEAQTPPSPTPTRAQLLYDTHCIACHSAQMHWRDKKLATDWPSLKALVRSWQATAGQFWSEADIVEVARYLNEAYYRFPQSSDVVGSLAPTAR
jgi:mono/diheme cytochrome c family protein